MDKTKFIGIAFKTMMVGLALISTACGGGGSSDVTRVEAPGNERVFFDYSGVWDVRYNLIKDECRLVFSAIIGVTDQQVITQDGTSITIFGLAGLLDTSNGFLDESGALVAEHLVQGDVFGNGDFCSFTTSTVYELPEDVDENTAKTLLSVTIDCNSGFQCESQGVGVAERQRRPDFDVEAEESL